MQQATLEGQDFFTAYAAVIRDGLKMFEEPDLVKPIEYSDYPEVSGRTYLNRPAVFQDREVVLSVAITGATVADVVASKDALLGALVSGTGSKSLYVYSTNKTYRVRYTGASGMSWYTTASGHGVMFDLKLIQCYEEFQPETEIILDGNGD
ncbi:hypothetical protein [Pedobacter faecalis]|uniref:hypothetical protein n=1 Tax=Pedobacter faecalis TaxID=3041495 RepID=UPI002550021E|nr:hypothetical protein [Pedobacter sp. ELA7]